MRLEMKINDYNDGIYIVIVFTFSTYFKVQLQNVIDMIVHKYYFKVTDTPTPIQVSFEIPYYPEHSKFTNE